MSTTKEAPKKEDKKRAEPDLVEEDLFEDFPVNAGEILHMVQKRHW